MPSAERRPHGLEGYSRRQRYAWSRGLKQPQATASGGRAPVVEEPTAAAMGKPSGGQTPLSRRHPFGVSVGRPGWNLELFDRHSQGLAAAMGFAEGSRNEAGIMVFVAECAAAFVDELAKGYKPLPGSISEEDEEDLEEEYEVGSDGGQAPSEDAVPSEGGGAEEGGEGEGGGGQTTPTVEEAAEEKEEEEEKKEEKEELLPIDERLAKVGLSVKLHFDQTLELFACAQAMEDAFARSESQAPVEVVASRLAKVFVVLRAVRGAAGIKWAAKELSRETATALLGMGDDTEALKETTALLLRALPEDDGGGHSIGHREGRHLFYSGRYALEAIAQFPESAAVAARLLAVVIQAMLTGSCLQAGGQTPVGGQTPALDSAHVLLAVLACEGRLPLAISRHGGACFAGRYNALNAGWMLLGWGWRSRRIRSPAVDAVLLHVIRKAQSDKSLAYMEDCGLNVPGALTEKLAALEAISEPMLPPRTDPLARSAPPGLFLGNVIAHLCEVGQLRAVVDDESISHVCSAGAAWIEKLATPVLRSLVEAEERLDGGCRKTCITCDVFAAVQAALQRPPTRRVRGKHEPESGVAAKAKKKATARSAKDSAKAKDNGKTKAKARSGKASAKAKVAAKTKAKARSGPPERKGTPRTQRGLKDSRFVAKVKGRWKDRRFVAKVKGRSKDRIACPQCGRLVRRDNMARHSAASRCVPGG